MVQGRLEISARKNPLEVYRKSARVPPADSARKNLLEVSRKSARVPTYTTDRGSAINKNLINLHLGMSSIRTYFMTNPNKRITC